MSYEQAMLVGLGLFGAYHAGLHHHLARMNPFQLMMLWNMFSGMLGGHGMGFGNMFGLGRHAARRGGYHGGFHQGHHH